MSGKTFDPKVELFTPESQRYLSGLPVSRAYFDSILMKLSAGPDDRGQQLDLIRSTNAVLLRV